MIVYVLFVHKKSVLKRKVCINFIKNKKFKKKPKKPIFSVFFWFFWADFFGVGFLLPTLAQGGAALRTARDGQDADGSRMRGPDPVLFPQAGRAAAGADVHRRRGEVGARCVRSGEGEVAGDYLYRRAGRDWDEAVRQREGGRPGGAADHVGAAQSARWVLLFGEHLKGQ
jgi:hypothetical protein